MDPSTPPAPGPQLFTWRNARAVERALELSPGNARALSLYSSVLLGEADMEGSVATARRAVEIDPLAVEIRRSLVARLTWAGLHEEAILEAERLLELDPKEADGHYYVGIALDGQGRYEDAIDAYERAIEINPEDPYYPAAVAYFHAMLGNREQAVLAAQQAQEAGVPLSDTSVSPLARRDTHEDSLGLTQTGDRGNGRCRLEPRDPG